MAENSIKMIDIHTHLLPGIDDGAKNCDESRAMLEDAFSQGVTLCVASPHCIVHKQKDLSDFTKTRRSALDKLKNSIKDKKCCKILLGAEVYLDNDISLYDGIEQICIEGTSYMLVELAENVHCRVISEWLYNLKLRGIIPVIAHIDRYCDWEKIVKETDGTEVLYQVNASRFLTFSGRRFIRKFLKHKGTFIVSSDMHNTSSRKCNMRKAYQSAAKGYGNIVDDIFENNAKHIISAQSNLRNTDLQNILCEQNERG